MVLKFEGATALEEIPRAIVAEFSNAFRKRSLYEASAYPQQRLGVPPVLRSFHHPRPTEGAAGLGRTSATSRRVTSGCYNRSVNQASRFLPHRPRPRETAYYFCAGPSASAAFTASSLVGSFGGGNDASLKVEQVFL